MGYVHSLHVDLGSAALSSDYGVLAVRHSWRAEYCGSEVMRAFCGQPCPERAQESFETMLIICSQVQQKDLKRTSQRLAGSEWPFREGPETKRGEDV